MAETDYSTEEWRDIPGWEGFYEVSSLGRIRSKTRLRHHLHAGKPRRRILRGRIRKLRRAKNGYLYTVLSVDNVKRTVKAHRAVALAFHGAPPPGKPQAEHLDGNKLNNRADNIAWASAKTNMSRQLDHGTRIRGEKVALAKLTESDVRYLREKRRAGVSTGELSREIGMRTDTVRRALTGETWAHVSGAGEYPPAPQKRPKGVEHFRSKVNESAVREIRRRAANGESQTSIAADFGINQVNVSLIVRRRTWKHID